MDNRQISIKVDHAGLQTTIQDMGRSGYQAEGIPVGGALDQQAALQANYLVGNSLTAPVLEITLLGPKLLFEEDTQIAITGADLSARLDGAPAPMDQTIFVQANSILRFGKPKKGCRAYLAIGGAWQVTDWLGSASQATQHADKLTPDSLLKKGQRLTLTVSTSIQPRQISPSNHYHNEGITSIETLPGPDFESFERKHIAHFFAQSYTITPSSNRMGYRLSPNIPSFTSSSERISSGIVPGTIQITNNGQPIVLLADAQTVGGYPRIANLTSESLNIIAQLRPGNQLRFILKA